MNANCDNGDMVKTLAMIAYMLSATSSHSHSGFELTSHAFQNSQFIPVQFTCRGDNHSFPLQWHHVPGQAKSLALIMSDPDAPSGKWYHWVVYNIPPDARGIQEGARYALSPYEVVGKNSWGSTQYGGPCPPNGLHHYEVKVYALNSLIFHHQPLTGPQLKQAMHGHVIASAKLTGRVIK